MADSIRKISVGPDYMNSMTYAIGKRVLDGKFEVRYIVRESSNEIAVYIANAADEVFVWKRFTATIPIHIEYDINF